MRSARPPRSPTAPLCPPPAPTVLPTCVRTPPPTPPLVSARVSQRKVQRRWRKHVENKQLARGLAKGAVQHKKTRGGAYHEKKLELGGDYLQYANPTDAKGKPRRSSMGQKLRGKEPSTRLKLSEARAPPPPPPHPRAHTRHYLLSSPHHLPACPRPVLST